ncbi:MAG: hypothetical protein L3K16_09685 [Thermoplasmata archaeon]|nr:hypothetical protein [Thermoplasmata archaeon]
MSCATASRTISSWSNASFGSSSSGHHLASAASSPPTGVERAPSTR